MTKRKKKPSKNTLLMESSDVVKFPRVIAAPENMILPHFRTSMNDFIKSKLTTKVRDAKEKQASKKIEDLKNKSLKDKRLPTEIINNTATMSGCSPTVLRDYLDKNLPKKNAGARSDNQPKEQSPAENDGSLVCKDNKTNYDRSTKDLDLSKILPKEFVSTTQILGPAPLPICL
ncbi:hypothetical protein HPULCUR_002536 [Helicostylum pulchrum]|uniref:Uncharacterized protein n=1 Tax=Helicostylum pulchrum TaxID=562976 RepID=A0ABP9XQW0_9FUNG